MRLLSIFILCLGISIATAQEQPSKINVVTKRVSASFSYTKGTEVNLEGENAQIFVESWDKNSISIEIELISKHPDKAIAERDLNRMAYGTKRFKQKIYIRNYISEEESKSEADAVLQAKYYIKVPSECPVYLKNYFGTTNVKNLASNLRIFGEFSTIDIEDIKGFIDMRTRFGDITANRLDGDVTINSRRSDVFLYEVSGNYDIDSEYGKLEIMAANELINLNIKAKKTDVLLYNIDPMKHQYALQTQYGQLTVPSELNTSFIENTKQSRKINFVPTSEYYASISIQVAFGDLVIQKKR